MNLVITQYLWEDGFDPTTTISLPISTSLATQPSLLPCWAPSSTQQQQSSFSSVHPIGLPSAPNPPIVSQGAWEKNPNLFRRFYIIWFLLTPSATLPLPFIMSKYRTWSLECTGLFPFHRPYTGVPSAWNALPYLSPWLPPSCGQVLIGMSPPQGYLPRLWPSYFLLRDSSWHLPVNTSSSFLGRGVCIFQKNK